MSKGDDFGTPLRPTPSSRGGPQALEHTHPSRDAEGFNAESKFIYCKICGFINDKTVDQCAFCESTQFNKLDD